MFYFIALYYEFKATFDVPNDNRIFNYEMYYSDKNFKKEMVDAVANLFLALTVKILVKTASDANKATNVNNWVRGSACEQKFFDALRNEIASNLELEEKYNEFLDTFKIQLA